VASREAEFDRDSSLLVARGLHVLRYESAGGGFDHPIALVKPAAGFERIIQVISPPGRVDGWLERPGAAVFVRAADNGKIQIGVRRTCANGSLDAAFKLESVGVLSDDAGAAARTNSAARSPGPLPQIERPSGPNGSDGALLLAHISRRGDVSVKANEWAGGPDAPGRIEGLAILGLGRDGLRGEVQVLPGSRDPTWSEWTGEDDFAGTRGRHQPLLGVRMRLAGDQVHSFIIHAEALFLGSAILSKRGREVECLSVSGRDPLVGLRLEIGPERRATARAAISKADECEQPRVRIFRAHAG